MIQEFVDNYMENKGELEELFKRSHPETYLEIVEKVVGLVYKGPYLGNRPNPKHITEVFSNSNRGSTAYIMEGDMLWDETIFWYVLVEYGTCAQCDLLSSILWDNDRDPPNATQVKEYMSLALHIAQSIKELK